MRTKELLKILRSNPHTAGYFTGVYPRDGLPKRILRNAAVIINTHNKDQPGEHWVAVYIGKDGRGVYFDPYGLPPYYPEFLDFLRRNTNSYSYHKTRVQDKSGPCGQYCVYFILCMIKKQPLQFKHSLKANDKRIQKWIKTV